MDIILGKRALGGSSAQSGRGYQKYGADDRSGNLTSGVELSSRGMRRKRAAEDDAALEDGVMRTLDTKDSQETILRQGQDPREGVSGIDPYKTGGIVRTLVFTVKYETDSDGRTSS